ncbi:MAG: dCTP deaminase [Deltaproteobacteria bacterium]|nr:dCTP deaminase [Deltaproteobacteria bacterium]
MILTDRQLREAIKLGKIKVEPFEDAQVQPATYDLRVGNRGATTSARKLIDVSKVGYLTLEPGDTAVVSTLEILELDRQHVGRFGLRSKYSRKGLIATTGTQIDPGFRGRLIIGLTNVTPSRIVLPHKDDFVSLEVHRLEEPAESAESAYDGPYQGHVDLRPEDIEFVLEASGAALPDIIKTMSGTKTSASWATK